MQIPPNIINLSLWKTAEWEVKPPNSLSDKSFPTFTKLLDVLKTANTKD